MRNRRRTARNPAPRSTLLFFLPLLPLLFLLFLPLLLLPHAAHALLLGNVDFRPTLRLEGVFDDNIFRRPQHGLLPVEDDYFTRIVPAVAFSYDRGPTDLFFRYRNELLFYKNFSEMDARGGNHGFDLGIDHAWGERTSLSLANTFRIGTDISSIAETGGAGPVPPGILPRGRKYRTNTLHIGGNRALTRRVSLFADISYQYNWYGTSLEGAPGNALRTEDHLASIFFTGVYALRPLHSLTASLGFSHNQYEQRGKARYLTATLGYQGQPARALTLEGHLGLQYLNEDSPPDSSIPGRKSVWPTADISAAYVYYDLTANVSASVGLSDTSGYGGTAIRRQVRAGLDYRPWQDLTLRAYGLYTKSDDTTDEPVNSQNLETFQGGAGASYPFATWGSARLNYTYIDQDAGGDIGGTYKDNRIVIGLAFTLPANLR